MVEKKIFKAKKVECYSFKDNEKDYDKLRRICDKCKYFDKESGFPNCFCDKSNEMIDFWFCSPKCPLEKWEIVEQKENENAE